MIALLCATALAAPLRLVRVELLADDPGTWLNYEAPLATARPAITALRFVEQVQPTWALPWPGWTLGTSLAAQTVSFEHPIGTRGLGWAAGLQTALLLPRGALATLSWERGPLRLAAGASLLSTASWRHPHWTRWQPLPTLAIALKRR